jgi:hypothetical protein
LRRLDVGYFWTPTETAGMPDLGNAVLMEQDERRPLTASGSPHGRARLKVPLVVAAIAAASLPSASSAFAAHSPTATRPPFPTNTGTICASTPTSPATARPHPWFEQAKTEWVRGDRSDAASEALCWTKAADDLESITTVATTGTSGFLTAANRLQRLAMVPDAMDTPAQVSEARSLIASLDRFFGTPGRQEGH